MRMKDFCLHPLLIFCKDKNNLTQNLKKIQKTMLTISSINVKQKPNNDYVLKRKSCKFVVGQYHPNEKHKGNKRYHHQVDGQWFI